MQIFALQYSREYSKVQSTAQYRVRTVQSTAQYSEVRCFVHC